MKRFDWEEYKTRKGKGRKKNVSMKRMLKVAEEQNLKIRFNSKDKYFRLFTNEGYIYTCPNPYYKEKKKKVKEEELVNV